MWKITREGHKDRAFNLIMDNYIYKDIFAFVRNYYQKDKSFEYYLRTALDFFIGYYFLLRGDNRCKLELADLNVIDFLTKVYSRVRLGFVFLITGRLI